MLPLCPIIYNTDFIISPKRSQYGKTLVKITLNRSIINPEVKRRVNNV